MKIEKLTKKQLALIPVVRDEWMKIGLSTEPVDRAAVREILSRLYAVANKPAPKFVIHLDSPLRVGIAIAQLRLDDAQVRAQVSDQVSAQVSDQVRAQVSAQVSAQVRDQVRDQVRAQVSAQVRDQVSAQVRDQVRDQVSDQVSDQVRAQVRAQVSDQVSAQVSDQVRAQVSAQVRDQVSDQVSDQVRDLVDWRWWYDFGQFDVWMSYYDFFSKLGFDTEKLQPSFDMAKAAGWSLLFWDWAFISAKPECIHRDEQGRLHSESAAAVRYPDGFSVFRSSWCSSS